MKKGFDATMRELEIIGEASNHLIKNKLLDKQWQIVVDFRNVIIHEYFGIDIDEIWEVIKIHLLEFEKEITIVMKSSNQDTIKKVIKSALVDYKYSQDTIGFLNKL
jgi:uncharacterized protein with HEPN domain